MTNTDQNVTTLTRWAILFPGETADLVIDHNSRHPWLYDTAENVKHALPRYREMFPREALRVARVEIAVVDIIVKAPVRQEGGQG